MNQSGSSSSNNKWNIVVIADPLADGHGFLLFQWFCYLFGFIIRKCPAPPTLACASFWISRTSVLQNWPKWWDSSIIFHHFGNIPTIPTASKQWFHPDLPGTVLPVVPRITSQHGTNQCSYSHGEHGENDALKVGSLGLKIGHDWSMAFPCLSHGIYKKKRSVWKVSTTKIQQRLGWSCPLDLRYKPHRHTKAWRAAEGPPSLGVQRGFRRSWLVSVVWFMW